jgi:hypothetical protein
MVMSSNNAARLQVYTCYPTVPLTFLIELHQMIVSGEVPLGMVHANGGLGSLQGFALLARDGS